MEGRERKKIKKIQSRLCLVYIFIKGRKEEEEEVCYLSTPAMARYDNSFLLFFIDIFVCICIFFLTLCIVFLGTLFFFFLRLFFFCCVQEPRKLYDVSRLKELQSWKRNFFSLFLFSISSIAKPPAPPSNTIKMKKNILGLFMSPPPKKILCVSVKPRASSRSEESTTLSTCVAFFFLLFFKIIIKRKFPIFCYVRWHWWCYE